jgi:hypothetical protein
MAKLRYVGPPGQSSTEISAELDPDNGAPLELVPGKTYEVSGELARKLLASDAKFERPRIKKTSAGKPAAKKSSPPPATAPSGGEENATGEEG